jgi:hypothetical protein
MLFEVKDPRGYKVSCSERCWHSHILDEHPEMDNEVERVKEAICNPTLFIYQDKDFIDRQIYYLLDISKRYYIKVTVRFDENNNGQVITAFKTDSPKPGEKMIWPKSNA